jgi:epoxide hydrolase-like predicted phosphatase
MLKTTLLLYEKIFIKDHKMFKLIDELKKKYMVVCLTNAEKEIVTVNEKNGLYAPFDNSFISCYINLRKPDFSIFRKVLKTLKVKPEECIFIDDTMEHIESAKKLGINAILYKNIKKLKSEIIKISKKTINV